MQLVPKEQVQKSPNYYLPHHFVLKDSSSTTKFRVVFDGSAKTTSNLSLNNAMLVGPTIQDDLFTLLIRFRTHLIALKADVAKMYRQFRVSENDSDFQRILWRESPDEHIKDYKLITVTYGTASAPFLATRCLQQLAKDESSTFPVASQVLLEDMYVDDLISGANNIKDAIALHKQLVSITAAGGMEIRKWMTNDKTVLNSIHPDLRETEDLLELDDTLLIAALGVQWKPSSDSFIFSVKKSEEKGQLTKRKLLSELAKVFDPLGFLSPTTINAKLIFQQLWLENLSWDDKLNLEVQAKWEDYQNQMIHIKKLRIPRCIITKNPVTQHIYGFSDASIKAYAAVVYLVSTSKDGTRTSRLIASKTRVAPVKIVSIPRLELCGAEVLAELIKSVMTACKLTCPVSAYTDSELVLKWLAAFPGRWTTFVANRVAKIQELIPFEQWNYVKTDENPADCASRGISAEELCDFSLWWYGPKWLQENVTPVFNAPEATDSEVRKTPLAVMFSQVTFDLITRFSSLPKLLHVASYMRRVIARPRPKSLALTPRELKSTLFKLIQAVQEHSFKYEFKKLTSKEPLTKSKILQINPFIDRDGLLRVGGRIDNSHLNDNQKHPIILPHDSHLTTIIIRQCHLDNFHSGFQLTHATLARDYWIVRGRDTIRHILRKCVMCRKRSANKMHQLMGSLPTTRVTPSSPFLNCGVDYAGPYSLLNFHGRGSKTFKAYFAVFVCFTTKAIHLEAVTDMSSEAFIACYKRFVSRRGVPLNMYSDCGKNFVGAENDWKTIVNSTKFNEDVSHHLVDRGTTWHFNPPAAPHQGGLWEAGVKSVKYHLRRVVGEQHLRQDEFSTLLCTIEAILNSRPLCAMSPDPSDLDALTPAHFLIGRPLTSIPEEDVTEIKENRLTRWQRVQQMTQHFWKRWSAEYLSSLQQRYKWTKKSANIQIGDLVLMHDETLVATKWKLARVIATHPGKDSLVRTVTVKTATGEFQRPIVKLSPILSPTDNE